MDFQKLFFVGLLMFVLPTAMFQIVYGQWKYSLATGLLFATFTVADKLIDVYVGRAASITFDVILMIICILVLISPKKKPN